MAIFKRKFILGPALLAAVSVVVYLPFRSRWDSDEQKTKQFCESLLPAIEHSRSVQGFYPTNIDFAWLAGRSVPPTLRTQDFYFGHDDRFILRFYRPGLRQYAFHSVWCYHSHEQEWFNQYEY